MKVPFLLETVQRKNNLNKVYCVSPQNPKNKGFHRYVIDTGKTKVEIPFQDGPRFEEGSKEGVLDVDLLEIVKHRLEAFQSGPYENYHNRLALMRITAALHDLDNRVREREKENKLGTNKI